MAMKATDLEKNRGLKINSQMRNAGIPDRFAKAAALPDKKEQRRRDQALGLVPFAVKINQELVKELQQQAVKENLPLNELVEGLLRKGLEAAK